MYMKQSLRSGKLCKLLNSAHVLFSHSNRERITLASNIVLLSFLQKKESLQQQVTVHNILIKYKHMQEHTNTVIGKEAGNI